MNIKHLKAMVCYLRAEIYIFWSFVAWQPTGQHLLISLYTTSQDIICNLSTCYIRDYFIRYYRFNCRTIPLLHQAVGYKHIFRSPYTRMIELHYQILIFINEKLCLANVYLTFGNNGGGESWVGH